MTNNWQKIRLGDVCANVYSGGTPKSTNMEYYGGNIPWLNTKEVHFNRIYQTEKNITEIGLKNSSAKWVPIDSVIVAMYGATAGNIAINKIPLTTNQACCNLIIDNSVANYQFIFYYLLLKNRELASLANGGAQQNLNAQQIKDFPISLPPLDVQRRIAGVLGVLDDKIELNNKINQNLDLQAQSLFNEIYNSSENGVLSDIVDIVESGNRPKGGACTSGIPSIGAENIEKFGVYDFSKEKFVSEEFFDNMKRGKVQSGDVLLYKDGAYTGKVSMALDGFPHKKCALNEHVFLLRANDKCSQFFLYYCLSCDKNKTYLHNLACAKAAQPGLNQQELLGMPIFIPEYDKIEKFTDIVNPLIHKIAQNALENIKLSAIRDALLPKLMSGEIDVENIPISDIIPKE